MQVLGLILRLHSFEFYTDGSLINLGKDDVSMGLACIQTSPNALDFTITAGIDKWPSSSRTELVTVIIMIIICPKNSDVHIFTDSQITIDSFHTIKDSTTPRKIFK